MILTHIDVGRTLHPSSMKVTYYMSISHLELLGNPLVSLVNPFQGYILFQDTEHCADQYFITTFRFYNIKTLGILCLV